MKTLHKTLDVISKCGFFETSIINNRISGIKPKLLGSELLKGIEAEWLKSNESTVGNDINIYSVKDFNNRNKTFNYVEYNNDPFAYFKRKQFFDNLAHVKTNIQEYVPLAIKETIPFKQLSSNKICSDSFALNLLQGTLLVCTYFLTESSAAINFHKIQRERKIWWMKLSTSPGRYILYDLKKDYINGHKIDSVLLRSQFKFGNIDVENITLQSITATEYDNLEDLFLKDKRTDKKILPFIIKTEFCLERAALALLLDSIEDSKREKIGIHRKLAPYQCALLCLSTELTDLAAHLSDVLCNAGLRTKNFDKCFPKNSHDLMNKLRQIDCIGVPYSLLLDSETLNNGLIKLRNRDTSICEIIHITDIPDYIKKIFI